MIKINGQCISTMAEFRSFFDADAMGRIGGRIADDSDLFPAGTEYASVRSLLRALAKDEGQRPTLRRDNTRMVLCLAGTGEVPLIYNIPPKEGEITRQNARKLLVGEIAAAEVELDEEWDETIHTDAGADSHFQGMNSEGRNTQRHKEDADCEEASKEGSALLLQRLQNKSVLGDAMIDIGGSHTYSIPPGSTAYLLKCDECYINKLPQCSVSSVFTCFMKYNSDGNVTVVCIDSFGQTKNIGPFKAEELQQVCADRTGGFVALINGKIVTYSREVQPDDITDMFLPEDERVVMIRTAGRQIVALTDKKRVYSNYNVDVNPNRPVLWIGQSAEGTLNFMYEDDYSFPGNVDVVDTAKGKYVYDKGELKKA